MTKVSRYIRQALRELNIVVSGKLRQMTKVSRRIRQACVLVQCSCKVANFAGRRKFLGVFAKSCVLVQCSRRRETSPNGEGSSSASLRLAVTYLRSGKIPCLQVCFLILRAFSLLRESVDFVNILRPARVCLLKRAAYRDHQSADKARKRKNCPKKKENRGQFLFSAAAALAACGHLRPCKIPCLQVRFLGLQAFSSLWQSVDFGNILRAAYRDPLEQTAEPGVSPGSVARLRYSSLCALSSAATWRS